MSSFHFWSQSAVALLAMALSWSLLLGSADGRGRHSRTNVLLFIIDDLRADYFGASSDEVEGMELLTPNLDKLAGRPGATVFTRAYCQFALCSPSRSSFLTGLRPDSTRVFDLETKFRARLKDVATLPQHFRAHGYWAKGVGNDGSRVP